jgi:hypothetical protein
MAFPYLLRGNNICLKNPRSFFKLRRMKPIYRSDESDKKDKHALKSKNKRLKLSNLISV